MKKTLLFLITLFCFFLQSNCYGIQKTNGYDTPVLKIITWNIQYLGGSKNDAEIDVIAKILKDYDLVAIQEVVGKDPAGAKAVIRIMDVLNRIDNAWDYSISNPTKSTSNFVSERYAYLWKTAKIRLKKKAFLDMELENIIEREPYIGLFEWKQNNAWFYVVNMHARTYNKHPEMEISNFKKYPNRFQTNRFIILGDFNLNEKHTVWNPLYKMGFASAISNQPTTLKKTCVNGNYLNYPIDNIYYNTTYFTQQKAYAIDFVKECNNLAKARRISDHLPVVSELLFNH